jgi:hypothetical protein
MERENRLTKRRKYAIMCCQDKRGERAVDQGDRQIHQLLRELGLNRTYEGYQYLVYILELVRAEPERLDHATKGIYPDVSRAFQVDAGRVDGALRTAARVCWKTRPAGGDGPPTVSRFLRRLAQEDRRRAGEDRRG